jgi:hypothetical protein
MYKLFTIAAVAFSFLSAAQPNGSAEKAETSSKTKPTGEDKTDKKATRQAERAQKMLTACETTLAELEAKEKSLASSDKKMVDLAIKHAKLEQDAAKDPEMADHKMYHVRQCKRYLSQASKHAKNAEKSPDAKETAEEKK